MMRASFLAVNNRWQQFRGSTLMMNSVFLMLATVAVAASGFVFWVIVSRRYDATTVGLAATLLSLSGLLSMLSLAGFDSTFVRFLPESGRKNDHINSGFMIVTLTSALLALCFALSFPFTSPRLAFVSHNPWYLAGFIFFTVVTALNVLTNSIFLSLKRAWDIFIINVLFSTFKIALPLLVTDGNAILIFVFVGISQLAGLILSLVIIKAELHYVFSPKVHLDILRKIKKYSFSVYAASILNLLPPTLLPLLVVHYLGADDAAYYYMAFTIASVLYTICYATMQSVFAEGSHDEAAMRTHVAKAARLIGALLIPAVLLTVGLSSLVLKVFGDDYSARGTALLQLFAMSAVVVAVYSALGAIFKVTRNLRGVVIMNVVYALGILGGSYLFVPRYGVIAIGWSWMFGNAAAAGTGLVLLKTGQHKLG